MILYNVELNESNSKYADYLKWFVSLDYESQKREFRDMMRKCHADFSASVFNYKREFDDAVEKFRVIRRYLINNNLCEMF